MMIYTIVFVGMFIFVHAQECTTTWPYIYNDFKKGTLYFVGGKEYVSMFNIHVRRSQLHYLENDIIKEAQNKDVYLVKIDNDVYMSFEGKIMKVIGSEERGFVATLILGDYEKLNNSTGAYGTSSSVSSTKNLTSVEAFGSQTVNHMVLKQTKEDGAALPLVYKYYIVTKNKVYPATKNGILSLLNESERAAFKKFLKTHKIKWKDTQSLLQLLDFFNSEAS